MIEQPTPNFTIANVANGDAVIYVTQDTTLNELLFTITYTGSVPATFKGGPPVEEGGITPQGPTSYYFTITPRLSPAEFKAIEVAPPSGWQVRYLTSFAITPVADLAVKPGDRFEFRLTNIRADGQPGPGSFNVDYYNVPGTIDGGSQLSLALENVPSLHKRLADVLALSFANGNTVYVDADNQGKVPPNTLTLRFNNTSAGPLVPPGTPWPNTPVFYLSFVTAAAPPGYGALTTVDRLKNVTVSLAGDYGTTWTIQDRTQQTPPHWAIYPRTHEILDTGAGAIVEFRIDGIVTDFAPSATNLYVQSSYIPGYDDGIGALPIDKRAPVLAIQEFRTTTNNVPACTEVPLLWRTFDANRCELSPVDGRSVDVPAQSGVITPYTVKPQMTTTYTLTAFNDAQGTRTSAPLSVDVQPVSFAKPLTASPETGIHYGDPVTLSWATTSALSCSIEPPIDGSASVPLSSDGIVVHPARTVQYTLTARGQGGPIQGSVTLVPIPNGWRAQANAGLWDTLGRPVLLSGFKDRLWFLAGGTGDLKSAVFRSIDGFNWEYATKDAKFAPRSDAAGCVFAGKLWLCGGRTRDGVVNEVLSSADGQNWTQVPASAHWSPRAQHACLVSAGKMWILGGMDAGGSPLGDVWNSADGITWTQVTSSAVWPARCAFGATVFNGAMCIVAGMGASRPLADAWQSSDGNSWEGLADVTPWPPRSNPNVNAVAGRLYVIGGVGSDGRALSDCHTLAPGHGWELGLGPNWSPGTLNLGTATFLGAQWFAGGTVDGVANRTVWGLGLPTEAQGGT